MQKIKSYDVGSIPIDGDLENFNKGASNFNSILSLLDEGSDSLSNSIQYFKNKIINAFLEKLESGIDIPNYPQFRDMNTMFFDIIEGIQRTEQGYLIEKKLSIRDDKTCIPEIRVIEKNSRFIYEKIGTEFNVKMCITGPYTLASLIRNRNDDIYLEFSDILKIIISNNIFKNKYSTLRIVSIDEPVFGLFNDSSIDYGTEGREKLYKAWEKLFHEATSRGVECSIHLHSTVDELFWDIKPLKIIESHVDDPIYSSIRTKNLLEEKDKFLKASLINTNFEKLIIDSIKNRYKIKDESILMEKVAKVWKEISDGHMEPNQFLESESEMKKRLTDVVNRYGAERVLYAGPECGMKSFPTYDSALECLKRISNVLTNF